ncbi:PhzF family phenazine biosynthesis protein [Orrella sp. JC864]|uniref:PhzF family phenazine biosynthesis protein n=1 Tax=Orrella sp. JC864 TaxID=3120298 RepID=UPI0012BBD4E2
MAEYAFSLVNVFARAPFGGNPLCVFEDALGLTESQMQSLARQFNLSETVFVLPPEGGADARVRIFTPGMELPFAGHPLIGTAHVVSRLAGGASPVTLQTQAGAVTLEAVGDDWVFTAPVPSGGPRMNRPLASNAEIAAMLGLQVDDLLDHPVWVDTGNEQLLVPVKNPDIVRRAQPNAALLGTWPANARGRKNAYVFSPLESAGPTRFGKRALARYFFSTVTGGIDEDPGTGSACANLGGWLILTGKEVPTHVKVEQGTFVGRPCTLQLEVRPDGAIRVGGRVMPLGQGVVNV